MIVDFLDQATKDIFDGTNSRAARGLLPRGLHSLAARKLDLLNAAARLEDLLVPPGNRLEKLRGVLTGLYSIRINQQYGIVFAFSGGHASAVRIRDYH